MRSSHRLVLIVLALAALAVPSTLAAKPAPNKCAKGAEKSGCKLPVGAEFFKAVKNGSANGVLTLHVIPKGVSVTIQDVWIHCKTYVPLIGDEIGIADHFDGKQRPKVGKTYTISKSESQTDEDGSVSSADSTLTLNFKSAKQLSLKLHHVDATNGQTGCDGSGSWTLKRR